MDDFIDLLEELREINLVKSNYKFRTVTEHPVDVFIEMRSRVRNTDSKVWFTILSHIHTIKGYAPRNLHKYIKITTVEDN